MAMSQAAQDSQSAAAGIMSGEQERIVREAIREISHIATLPEVTLKIIRLVEDPDSTAQDLNKVITNDPALGARILKVVNSAFYGLPGQIASLNRAIVLLGLNAVKNIAIAASLAKLFRGGQICPTFNARDLWTHSIAVATGSRLLAQKAGLGLPDEAFLAGLIHDLGIIVEMQARRQKFVDALEKADADPKLSFRDAETAALGAHHEQFGTGLCQLWKFPKSMIYVTGYHHRPLELAEGHRTLALMVHIADALAARSGLGWGRDVDSLDLNPRVLEQALLSEQAVQDVADQLEEATEEARSLLNDA
jgi:HD-like signal output (HDOD) protein